MRKHPGGYGMYYHFDYHGWPTSYEWINSSYLPEKSLGTDDAGIVISFEYKNSGSSMGGHCNAGNFRYRFLWIWLMILSVGGTTAPNTTDAYTRLWVKRQFGRLSEVQQAQIADIPDRLYKDDTQMQTGGVKTGNLSCSKLS